MIIHSLFYFIIHFFQCMKLVSDLKGQIGIIKHLLSYLLSLYVVLSFIKISIHYIILWKVNLKMCYLYKKRQTGLGGRNLGSIKTIDILYMWKINSLRMGKGCRWCFANKTEKVCTLMRSHTCYLMCKKNPGLILPFCVEYSI